MNIRLHNIIRNRRIRNNVILFLFGFIVLSPWSSIITIEYLHLPLSLPEILFIPFLPFFINNFKFHNIFKSRFFFILLTSWLLLLIIGIMHNDPFSIISTSRTWLYIIIFYCIFIKDSSLNLKYIYLISIGGVAGWMIAAYRNFKTMILLDNNSITYGPMLAVVVTIVYPLVKDKNLQFIIAMLFSIIIGFIAGLRRELAIAAICIISTWVMLVSLNRKKLLKYVFISLFMTIVFISAYSDFSEFIKKESHFLYDRVILKTESMFSGESNQGDENRINNITKFGLSFYEYLVPQGFVNKQYFTKDGREKGIYNDLPIAELATSFSFLIAIPLILYFAYAVIRLCAMIYCHKMAKDNIVYAVGGIVMIMLLFLEGSFITFPYCAPYTGYMLGRLQYKSGIRLKLL